MKRFQTNLILSLFFIIIPFLSLPFLFIEIYKGNRYTMLLLAIFMGGLSMFYFPSGDQYRYMIELVQYRYLSFDSAFDINSSLFIRNFNLIHLLLFISSKIGITLEQIRFLLTFISCCLFFSMFIDLSKNKLFYPKTRLYFCCFFIIFLSIPFYLITYGFRTGFAASLLTYGIYYLFYKRNNRGFIFLVLSALCHYFFITYLVIIAFVLKLKIRITKRKAIIIAVVLLLVFENVIAFIYGSNSFIDLILDQYVFGEWGNKYEWDIKNIRNLFLNGGLGIILLLFLSMKIKKNEQIQNFITAVFIFIIISLPYYTLLQRTIRIIIPILTIYIVSHMINKKIYSYRKLILWVHVIAFILPFWLNRYIYIRSGIEKIIYSPLTTILTNTYSITEVNKQVRENGEFILYH